VSFCFSLLGFELFSVFLGGKFSAAAALSARNRLNSLLDKDSSISSPA